MITDDDMIARMAKGWARGNLKAESQCGTGSHVNATNDARKWLLDISEEFNIKSVVDVGAGDLNWIGLTRWNLDSYIGLDCYPRHENVKYFDGTKEVPPKADLILCRQVMIHLPKDRFLNMLANFKESKSTYLAATTWDNPTNIDYDRDYHHMDLRNWLGTYLRKTKDTSDVCFLALWRLN